MALVTHVLSAIDDFGQGKLDNALMHASFAIEATTRGSLQEGTKFPSTPLQPFTSLSCSQ